MAKLLIGTLAMAAQSEAAGPAEWPGLTGLAPRSRSGCRTLCPVLRATNAESAELLVMVSQETAESATQQCLTDTLPVVWNPATGTALPDRSTNPVASTDERYPRWIRIRSASGLEAEAPRISSAVSAASELLQVEQPGRDCSWQDKCHLDESLPGLAMIPKSVRIHPAVPGS